MRTRLMLVAVPALIGVAWLTVAHGSTADTALGRAETAIDRAEVVRSLHDIAVGLRRLRVDVAVADASDRPVDSDGASTRQLADATNALQRRLGMAGAALAPSERAALGELGADLGTWGEALADAKSPLGPAADDLAARVGDVIAALSGAPSTGRWSGRMAALDRVERAGDADLAVYVAALGALGRPPADRVGVARDVTSARRRASGGMADALAAANPSGRRRLESLRAGVDRELLAAFGDDEVVRTMTGTSAGVAERAARRARDWSAVVDRGVDELLDAMRADRASLAVARRSAWSLGATWALLAVGLSLIVASRLATRRDESADGSELAAGPPAPSLVAQPDPTPQPDPTSEHEPAGSPRTVEPSERDEAVLSCLVEFARRQRTLLDEQIDLAERLGLGRAPEPDRRVLSSFEGSIARSRRLIEAVLVLAGADADRAAMVDAPLDAVLRAAVDEVGSTTAVVVPPIDAVTIDGARLVEVAHLFAELLDLGPMARSAVPIGPDGPVERVDVKVRGIDADNPVVMLEHRLVDGARVSPAELRDALDGRWVAGGIGWMAAGELARRLGLEVSVDPASGEHSVRVAVVLGSDVTTGGADDRPTDPQEERMVWGWTAAGEYLPATGWRADGEFVGAPARLDEAVPSGAAFDRGLSSLLEEPTGTMPGGRTVT